MNKKVALILVFALALVVNELVGVFLYWKRPQDIVVQLPIDTKEEAIAYAKTDPGAQEFMKKCVTWEGSCTIDAWAHFDDIETSWTVGVYVKEAEDLEYDITFQPDGTLLRKGPRGI